MERRDHRVAGDAYATESRDKDKPDKIRVEMIRYQRFVQTLSTLGDRVEFRLSFHEGRGKVLISARGRVAKGELQERLLGIVKAHLPEFKARESYRSTP